MIVAPMCHHHQPIITMQRSQPDLESNQILHLDTIESIIYQSVITTNRRRVAKWNYALTRHMSSAQSAMFIYALQAAETASRNTTSKNRF